MFKKEENSTALVQANQHEKREEHRKSSDFSKADNLYAFVFPDEGVDQTDALPEKLRYTKFDFLCTLISILTYLFDLVMDCVVAFYFYHLGITRGIYHYWYFGLTLAFILLPAFTMTGFSLRWYLMDADNDGMDPVPLWRWCLRLVVLFFQLSPILRYVDSIRYGLLSRRSAIREKNSEDPLVKSQFRLERKKFFTLMVYEDADATLLRLFEGFMESAPQLVLQIYILIQDPRAGRMADDPSDIDAVIIKTSILVISITSSLISLAWSLVAYHRSLRYTFPDKNNINWIGSVFQFAWHFSSITARVLALSLFASVYPTLIGPVCAAHWIVMASWVVFQRTEACRTPCEEFLFAIVLGAIYIFSFFNAKGERTRYKYLIYYGFCLLENTALIVVWFVFTDSKHWYYYPGIVGHYLAFFGGIFFMVIYYAFFHPTGVDVSFLKKIKSRRTRAQKKKTVYAESGKGTLLKPLSIHVEERPLSASSRCLSSPVLDELGKRIGARSIRRSASAPTPNSPYAEARRLKDMAGRNR